MCFWHLDKKSLKILLRKKNFEARFPIDLIQTTLMEFFCYFFFLINERKKKVKYKENVPLLVDWLGIVMG